MEIFFLDEKVRPITAENVLHQMKDAPFDEDDLDIIHDLTAEAADIARPKAVFMKAAIQELGEDYIIAENTRFTSSLLRKNVSKCSFILPYTASCGRELHEWSLAHQADILEMYVADVIMELYLRRVSILMRDLAKKTFYPDCDISSMAPGSLDTEWPITQQRPLFSLLGEQAKKVGVELTDSCLMVPAKSVSGFYFSADQHFENCMLCTRLNCPNRRAKYKNA